MDIAELRALVEAGETSTVEFKLSPPRYAELAERICAFANASGGIIIFGVQDVTWKVVGLKDISRARDIMLQAARHCKPTVEFEPTDPEVFNLDGKLLMVAQIPANSGILHQAGGVYWMRRGTHSVPLELDEIEQFLYRRGSLVWETRPVERARLSDLDMVLVENYLTNRSKRVAITTLNVEGRSNLEELLINLECAARIKNQQGQEVICPTNAGLMLFGKHPQNFLIQAEAICTLYPDELGLRRYADRRILHGTIPQQVDQAETFFRQFIPVAGRVDGFHMRDEPDYPIEALREAVVNALVHRDYSLKGEAVRIFYYADRIEIHSPGLLLPDISLEALKEGRVRSRPRNPVIASVLRDFPGGYMERLGTGIRFMIAQMLEYGLPAPDFREMNEFIVTFQKAKTTARSVPTSGGQSPISERKPDVDEPLPIPAIPEKPLSAPQNLDILNRKRRQELGFIYIREHGAITNLQYRALTGASANTALRDLEELVEQGSLRRIGKRRASRYELPQ